MADRDVEARHEPERSDQPAEIPVRLGAVRSLGDVVGAPEPDRVDLHQPAEQEEHCRDRKEQPQRPRRLPGERRNADDLLLRRAPALAELGVVPRRDEEQVQPEQGRDQNREQEDVGHVHPRLEVGVTRKRGAPEQQSKVPADHRDRHQHRVADREPHPGEQVVDQRIPEVALEQGEDQHRQAEVVGQVARLAERTGEEDAQHVQDDRGDEDIGRPVVRLPHQQAGAHLEREVDRGAVGDAHLVPTQRQVVARVVSRGGAGLEEECQVDARPDEDHERVEGDLAEQERPVVRKHIAQRLLQEWRRAAALVEEANEAADHDAFRGAFERTPDQDGPTGPEKLPAARRTPLESTASGSCGSGLPAGPKITFAPRVGSKVE